MVGHRAEGSRYGNKNGLPIQARFWLEWEVSIFAILSSRPAQSELEGQSKLCQVRPCKSDLLKGYASDLNLFGPHQRSARFFIEMNCRIPFEHPHSHALETSSGQRVRKLLEKGCSQSLSLSPIEQVDCKQLSIVSRQRLTYRAAANEAYKLSVLLGDIYLDVAGKPVLPQQNALGLVQAGKIVVRDDS
jgi:hypothetical protein